MPGANSLGFWMRVPNAVIRPPPWASRMLPESDELSVPLDLQVGVGAARPISLRSVVVSALHQPETVRRSFCAAS